MDYAGILAVLAKGLAWKCGQTTIRAWVVAQRAASVML